MTTEKQEKKAPAISLKGRQKKYLRSLGHHTDPSVYVGKEGITPTVIQSVLDALRTRELIKVKLGPNCEVPKQEAADLLAEKTDSALVQLIGRMVLLYLPNKKLASDRRIVLPDGRS